MLHAFRAVLACISAVLLAVAWLPAAVQAQADDTSYDLESGNTVSWSSPWALVPEYSGAEEGVETVFLSTQLGIVVVMTLPAEIDVELARDQFLEGFFGEFEASTTIDRGAYDGLSYSLDILLIEEFEYGAFSLFRAGSGSTPTFVTFFIAPISAFASEFSSAQNSVQVDGTGIFPGVGGQGLQDLLEANSGSATTQPSGDDATDDGTDDTGDGTEDGT
ncbi:MAG TPA: hypothetical protein VD767_03175, partial [Thermomicrobiales bacterium]|nr:hypothetical protein [Thermomicrobiales bacterium]